MEKTLTVVIPKAFAENLLARLKEKQIRMSNSQGSADLGESMQVSNDVYMLENAIKDAR